MPVISKAAARRSLLSANPDHARTRSQKQFSVVFGPVEQSRTAQLAASSNAPVNRSAAVILSQRVMLQLPFKCEERGRRLQSESGRGLIRQHSLQRFQFRFAGSEG
jgi:hypothetical protein